MRQSLSFLRSEATARMGSMMFVFLVAWAIGLKAGGGMSGEQWTAAAASIAGALLVAILVHGPDAMFRSRGRN